MAKKKSGKRKRAQEEDIALDYDDNKSNQPGATANTTFLPLTGQCHHYRKVGEVPFDIQKYWHQRHSIFSEYDAGIQMTDDAWFGVTPEPVANQIATDLSLRAPDEKTTIIDIFAGAGGNAIAFALSERWTNIIAIEKDASTLACAQHNAAIYGVSEFITWVNADCFSYLSENRSTIDASSTVIFASPPWGGVTYSNTEIFDLSTMHPYSIQEIHKACTDMYSVLYLPRHSDLRQVAKLAPKDKKIDIVQYCMKGASKALVAYVPASST